MRLEVRSEAELTGSEREHIRNWIVDEFDPQTDGFEWSQVDYHVLGMDEDRLVSHAEIVVRIGRVGGQPVRLGGIGGVVTKSEWRGRGFGAAVMERAVEFMCRRLGVEFGLLICDPQAVGFYERLGWHVAPAPMFFTQPGGVQESPDVTMVIPCGGREWPEGSIDLCGPPW